MDFLCSWEEGTSLRSRMRNEEAVHQPASWTLRGGLGRSTLHLWEILKTHRVQKAPLNLIHSKHRYKLTELHELYAPYKYFPPHNQTSNSYSAKRLHSFCKQLWLSHMRKAIRLKEQRRKGEKKEKSYFWLYLSKKKNPLWTQKAKWVAGLPCVLTSSMTLKESFELPGL